MDLLTRAKNIVLTPNTEWPVIAQESTEPGTLITGYVVPLAALAAVAGFVGGTIIGRSAPFIGTYRIGIVSGVTIAVFSFVMAIVSVFIVSLIINALAPTFGGEKSSIQAMKVAAYAYTPAWIAGVFQLLPVFGIGGLLAFVAGLYGLYLLYLGLPRLMKCPQDKAIGYTAVVVVCAIVLFVCVGAVTTMIGGVAMIGSGVMSGGLASSSSGSSSSRSSDVQFAKDSTLGKLQALGDKLETSNKKMEAAQKSGDPNAQAAAAMESLGTLLGGGKRVDPIGIDQIKPFVPETFAGLARKSSNAEKNGMAGLMVTKAEATFGDGADKSVTLEITDTGGVSGMLGFASWMNMAEEKDNDSYSERTRKENGRIIHEKMSKRGGENEFGIVLGDRFVVGAKGNVPFDQLRAAVGQLDLGRLEAMKGAGVQK
jgi:Yip1-like protein